MSDLILTCFLLFFSSAVIMYSVSHLFLLSSLCAFFKDPPGNRKIHQRTVPRIGGVCAILVFLMGISIWYYFISNSLYTLPIDLFQLFFFATISILIIGILDDSYTIDIRNSAKFILEVIIALELVLLLDVKLSDVRIFEYTISLGNFGIPITILWIVGITNAINIIDGIDGLAGSIAFCSFTTIGLLAFLSGAITIVLICILLAGITMGFLMHNKPPAKIFLGDTGALFIGMMIGILSIKIVMPTLGEQQYPVYVMFLSAGIPIVDVSIAMIRRFFKAIGSGFSLLKAFESMGMPDNDHIHHRLIHRGMNHFEAVVLLSLLNLIFCCASVIASMEFTFKLNLLALYVSFITIWLLFRLDFISVGVFKKLRRSKSIRRKKYEIAVINPDEILRHTLTYYEQIDFSFHYFMSKQMPQDLERYGAIVLFENSDNYTEIVLNELLESKKFKNLVIVTDVINNEKRNSTPSTIFYMNKPVYIPLLLNDLYIIASKKKIVPNLTQRVVSATRFNLHLNGISNAHKKL